MNNVARDNTILIASGFYIPYSPLYTKIESTTTVKDNIYNISNGSNDDTYVEFLKSHNTYASEQVTGIGKLYNSNKSPENYYTMVTTAGDILSSVTLFSFMNKQACNPILSCIAFNYCIDLAKYVLENNPDYIYNDVVNDPIGRLLGYTILPYKSRLNQMSVTKATMDKRVTSLNKLKSSYGDVDMITVLSRLSVKPDLFYSMYMFILGDGYES